MHKTNCILKPLSDVRRDLGLSIGDFCQGTCKFARAAISDNFLDNPYVFCGANGTEIKNAGVCLPP